MTSLPSCPSRVGVLVPPANPTVEPEMHHLLSPQHVVHVARLPYLPGRSLADRLQAYRESVPETLRSFGSIPLRGTVFACTGASYPHGPAADAAFCAEVSAAIGVPFITAASALVTSLRQHGMPPLTLVSPYPDWLTEQAAAFLSEAGSTVLDVVPVEGDGSIYDLSSESVLAAVADRAPDRRGALLLAGTGMPTLAAVRTLSKDWPQPVLSSATCSAAWIASVTEGHA